VSIQGSTLAHFSRTQPTIALSSTEAEISAIVSSSAEGLSLQNILCELGVSCSVVVHTDSKASIDHAKRLGQGRLKHVALKSNYIQELLHTRRIALVKIPGEDNPADLLTKAVTVSVLRKLMCSELIGLAVADDTFMQAGDHVERVHVAFSDVDFDHVLAKIVF
jgi:hypothetical protein